MSANPLDVGLSRGHTRIAPTEPSHQSVRLALPSNLTNHITSNHDSTVLLHGKIGTGMVACAIDLLTQDHLPVVLRKHN